MPKLFCFGFGFCAQALARRLKTRGWQVAGTHRDAESADAKREEGYETHVFSARQSLTDIEQVLEGSSHLLVSIAPVVNADGTLSDIVLEQYQAVLEAVPFTWIGYISSTVVYGDHQGAWVDESSSLQTTQPRGLARVAAENSWLDLCAVHGQRTHIFRSAGIYGPGRNALVTMRSGSARRIVKPGHVTSRIHLDDIAATLDASIAAPNPGAIYNLADNQPAAQPEPLDYAAKLLGVEPAPTVAFEDLPEGSPSRKFLLDNRRVSNKRIKEELGVKLTYPSYREGLDALAREL